MSLKDHAYSEKDFEGWSETFIGELYQWTEDGEKWKLYIRKENGVEVMQSFTPRWINQLCRRLLALGYTDMSQVVDPPHKFCWVKSSIGIGNARWLPKPTEDQINLNP